MNSNYRSIALTPLLITWFTSPLNIPRLAVQDRASHANEGAINDHCPSLLTDVSVGKNNDKGVVTRARKGKRS